MKISRRRPVVGVAGFMLIGGFSLALSGCSSPEETSHVSATRTKVYTSIAELDGDSALVVVGTPREQEVVQDVEPDMDFTLSTFEVRSAQKGTSPAEIVVRQTGSVEQGAPAEILQVGQQYLLYLTPSGLPGEQAGQFYVTGLNAGIYEEQEAPRAARTSTLSFVQADPEPGEALPTVIEVPN